MRQYYIPDSDFSGNKIEIRGKDFHYLKNVLRLKRGDNFRGINKNGDNYKLTVVEEMNDSFILKSVKKLEKKLEKMLEIHLLQCLPKSNKMDLIVRQAAETGVKRIIPVISRNTIAKPNEKKAARWERIIKEAVQQSGTSVCTKIEKPVHINTLFNINDGIKIFFHQEPLFENSLFSYLQIGRKQGNLLKIYILIGPEGGFTNNEVKGLCSSNFKPVYLGKEILRVETAALYAIASVKTILFELNYQEDQE